MLEELLYLVRRKMFQLYLIYQVLYKITFCRILMVVTRAVRMLISEIKNTVYLGLMEDFKVLIKEQAQMFLGKNTLRVVLV